MCGVSRRGLRYDFEFSCRLKARLPKDALSAICFVAAYWIATCFRFRGWRFRRFEKNVGLSEHDSKTEQPSANTVS